MQFNAILKTPLVAGGSYPTAEDTVCVCSAMLTGHSLRS